MDGTQVDNEFVKWLATLGVGGVLAAGMFLIHRKDWAGLVASIMDKLANIIDEQKEEKQILREERAVLLNVVKDNTEATTKLISLIEALHRRIDKIDERWQYYDIRGDRPGPRQPGASVERDREQGR